MPQNLNFLYFNCLRQPLGLFHKEFYKYNVGHEWWMVQIQNAHNEAVHFLELNPFTHFHMNIRFQMTYPTVKYVFSQIVAAKSPLLNEYNSLPRNLSLNSHQYQ